jgi:hypothetical protein
MSDINSIIGEPVEIPRDDAPAPEAPPAPAAEAPPAETPPAPAEAPAAEPAPKVVPYQALQEERRERQRLQAENRALMERMEARLAALQQAQQPPAPPAPDPNENPIGFLAHQQQAVGQRVDQLVQQSEQAQRQAQMAAAEAQLAARIQTAEVQFKASNPDYEQAIAHTHQLRVRELQALGHDPLAAEQQSVQELRQAAFFHAAHGRNPAELIYNLAKVRGYSPTPAAPSPAAQLQVAQRGTAAAASLGGGGGGTPGQLNARALAEMSDEDFAKVTDAQWRKAMGG